MRSLNLSQKPVRLALAGALGLSVVAGGAAIADAATGTIRTSAASLTVRSGPGTGYQAVTTIAKGTKVDISCQTYGTTVKGTYGTSNIWDKIGTGRYVSDAYVYTGRDGFVAPKCGGTRPRPRPARSRTTTPTAAPPPASTRGTSTRASAPPSPPGGCATTSGSPSPTPTRASTGATPSTGTTPPAPPASRSTSPPRVGDIAVRNSGTWGHVAYVAKVNSDGSFMVEEYNHVRSDTYSYRRATKGTGSEQFSDFIHFT